MPTYEYQCRSCDHQLEAFHAMSADPLRDCPACGEPALKRKIGTGAGLLFKGSGFYQTDYRSDSYRKGADAEKPKKKEEKSSEASKKGSDTSTGSKTTPASA